MAGGGGALLTRSLARLPAAARECTCSSRVHSLLALAIFALLHARRTLALCLLARRSGVDDDDGWRQQTRKVERR